MTTRTRRSEQRIIRACALHWQTFHLHVHGRIAAPLTSRDQDALREIVRVQALWHEDRALGLIEAIIRAPLGADTLARRYVTYWAWLEMRCPTWLHSDGVPRALARDVRALIAGSAA